MPETILQLDPRDNVLVALTTLDLGTQILFGPAESPASFMVTQTIPAKHKMAIKDLKPGDLIFMYGMVVGEVVESIPRGGLLTTCNIRHRAADYTAARHPAVHAVPDASAWAARTFMGYHRADGQVGTRNYWIVLPLVFCENRNIENMREALEEELGYGSANCSYRQHVRELIQRQGNGHVAAEMAAVAKRERVFPNVDGVRFLPHQGGCGGTRQDSQALCGLLAGYIHHPNVAGATVLSLGCQNAQSSMLMDEFRARDPHLRKPVLVFDQQGSGRETVLMSDALEQPFAGLADANRVERAPAPLSALTVGLKGGGACGFSSSSANSATGYLSDWLVGMGGRTLLSEFPELHGVEQELINRCATDELAQRFYDLMQAYSARAKAVHSGFEMNPSPGNIEDGLITDAIKSAGAARKGGISTVQDVLDFPQYATTPGLNQIGRASCRERV